MQSSVIVWSHGRRVKDSTADHEVSLAVRVNVTFPVLAQPA